MLLKLVFCFAGIFISYLVYGVTLELLIKLYGENVFKHSFLLVLIPSVCSLILAKISMFIKDKLKPDGNDNSIGKPHVPKKYYLSISILFMGTMLCANYSLTYITYPTQLIVKSSKPIPIILCGFILVRKVYTYHRLISTFVIVIGVSAFMYEQYRIKIHVENGQADKQTKQTITVNADSYKFGILLVLGSLTFDGLLATVQDKLKLNYTLQTYDMMYYVNVFSSILLFVAFIVSGELMSFRKMFGEESLIFFYLLLSGISSAVGQNFIYYTLTQFGPLTVSIMTTVRKFCNVFVLVLYFKHAFTMRLWIYVVIVFSGLGLDIWAQQQIGK